MPAKAKDKKTKSADISADTVSDTGPSVIDTQALIGQLSAIFSPQFDSIKKELEVISSDIVTLTSEVKQFSIRLVEAEERLSVVEDQTNIHQGILKKHEDKLNNMQLRLEDLEDRSRCNNIRIIGLPELPEFEDLMTFTSMTLPQALGMPAHLLPLVVERAHRTGPRRNMDSGAVRPRMIIFRLLKFQNKIELLNLFKKKKNEPVIFGNNKILLFQDFSGETSARRKVMAPFCTQLINKGINAWLMYPARVVIDDKGSRRVFNEVTEITEFLKSVG